ncbi:hypothetical protein CLV51_110122 [Chitinophaga niastensis]|uniref:Uncharacterized protein n=1 Tax=Chitinophaga niastensis TaxID=536980 RepID=A0A2P8H9K2_CHINA|nr:hypothetical protein CLV51_110122 [Chitinophaga niastensis]
MQLLFSRYWIGLKIRIEIDGENGPLIVKLNSMLYMGLAFSFKFLQ